MIETAPQPDLDSGATAIRAQLEEALGQLAELSGRVAGLEKLVAAAATPVAEPAVQPQPKPSTAVAIEAGISEEEVLAISAALAAWLGVQPHIRQIRLIRSGAWAQQGRVTIQASHGLHH
ncbi:MAG TPA: hypothetical protein VGN01_17445 [Acidobacteriaceae bacterium]|jgi:methylmalonyl-CoA carboxyltransferase large subunit